MMPKIKVVVAVHKPYAVPNDDVYFPVQVGATGKASLGWQRDDTGDNLSTQNINYSELTGLYWAWHNLPSDYLGLVHYRRYFRGQQKIWLNGKKYKILSAAEMAKIFTKVDVIVPTKRHYYIETLASHYAHTTYGEHLTKLGTIIATKTPQYQAAFEKLKTRRSTHICNMFIMKRELIDQYCSWLFLVLGELAKQVDTTNYTTFHKRYLGRISEMLLDVWLQTNHIKYREVKTVTCEKQHFWRRLRAFLRAKFKGVKY